MTMGAPALLANVPSMHERDLMQLCVDRCRRGGLYLEFGVSGGRSLTILRNMIPPTVPIYGFDSFEGLPEAWNGNAAGSYATKDRVSLPNVHLIEGWFADTLPGFLAKHPRDWVSFINIDCDLYESTRTVLRGLRGRIVRGTVIHFDEYFGYPGWEEHEHKALVEFMAETERRYVRIGRDDQYRLAIQIV